MGCNGSKQATAAAQPSPAPASPKSDGVLLGKTGGSEEANTSGAEEAKSPPPRVTEKDVGVGDTATLRATGEEVRVLKRTTTDILVTTPDGKEQWCDVESVSKAAAAGPRVGDDVIVRITSQVASVLQKTTTDLLVKTADGKEQWYDVEDVSKAEKPSVAGTPQRALNTDTTDPAANDTPAEPPVTQETPREPAGGGLFGCCGS
eukprot:gnl/TRDRNA2_/TRDRNA2_153491_c1_seq2.p1 gnl/TRDRNA2_/TRDRNA2_153491_c1~~gnl/TRDRNA2_/TRDRNA2_153491_c1_seq2.p1  ORF type:complete len:204 (+),score=44.62 gnl/TRDRNA2_/TRDRNA2_153491_c1_seq2:126-737(+)